MPRVTLALFVLLQGGAASELNPGKLILEASPLVKGVMSVLVLMSVGCWFIMGAKGVRILQATRNSKRFLRLFWGGEEGPSWTADRLEGVYSQVKVYAASPIASVFRAGYVELARVMGASQSPDGQFQPPPGSGEADIDNVARALKRTATNELTSLETMLPFLATTGATAPFIGLFGTVWGIMSSFISIRNEGSAGIEAVAPGIAEALIVTAIGLAAAIPAVMAYNFFVRRIRVLESEIEAFSNDYLNIVRRHFLRG